MPGRIDGAEAHAVGLDRISVRHADRDDVGLGLLAHDGDALSAVAQLAEPRDVVGVQVRVDRLDEAQVELVQELDVALDLLEDGIDDERFAAAPAREQVAVGARDAVEHLAKDHTVISAGGSERSLNASPRRATPSRQPRRSLRPQAPLSPMRGTAGCRPDARRL